jgi:hypothetical protein
VSVPDHQRTQHADREATGRREATRGRLPRGGRREAGPAGGRPPELGGRPVDQAERGDQSIDRRLPGSGTAPLLEVANGGETEAGSFGQLALGESGLLPLVAQPAAEDIHSGLPREYRPSP